MQALIDANILLDVLYDRKPFWEHSSRIWNLSESALFSGVVSALTVANIIYIMRKELNPDKTREVVSRISEAFAIGDLRFDDLQSAADMRWKDYEDALQVICASRNHADFIVTRNVRDFTDSPIPAVTPEEFLERLSVAEGGI